MDPWHGDMGPSLVATVFAKPGMGPALIQHPAGTGSVVLATRMTAPS